MLHILLEEHTRRDAGGWHGGIVAERRAVRSAFVTLYTSSTTALLGLTGPSGTWDSALVPDASLRSTDRQNAVLNAGLVAGSQNLFRTVRHDVRVGDAPSLALPAPIGSVQFEMTADRLAATLSAGTDYDQFILVRQGQPVGRQGLFGQTAVFSRSFIDDTGGTTAVLELDQVPGYQSEWRLDPAFPQTRQASVTRGTSTADSTTAGMSQSNLMVQGFQAPDAALRDDAAGLAAAHEPTVVVADDIAVFAPR
jgi:hypothetical protein